MKFIFKIFTGSFFRTLGRVGAYICIGLLLGLIVSKLDLNLKGLLFPLFLR